MFIKIGRIVIRNNIYIFFNLAIFFFIGRIMGKHLDHELAIHDLKDLNLSIFIVFVIINLFYCDFLSIRFDHPLKDFPECSFSDYFHDVELVSRCDLHTPKLCFTHFQFILLLFFTLLCYCSLFFLHTFCNVHSLPKIQVLDELIGKNVFKYGLFLICLGFMMLSHLIFLLFHKKISIFVLSQALLHQFTGLDLIVNKEFFIFFWVVHTRIINPGPIYFIIAALPATLQPIL